MLKINKKKQNKKQPPTRPPLPFSFVQRNKYCTEKYLENKLTDLLISRWQFHYSLTIKKICWLKMGHENIQIFSLDDETDN